MRKVTESEKKDFRNFEIARKGLVLATKDVENQARHIRELAEEESFLPDYKFEKIASRHKILRKQMEKYKKAREKIYG